MLDNITLSEEERTALFVRMLGKVGQHSSIGRNFTCQCGKHILLVKKQSSMTIVRWWMKTIFTLVVKF